MGKTTRTSQTFKFSEVLRKKLVKIVIKKRYLSAKFIHFKRLKRKIQTNLA